MVCVKRASNPLRAKKGAFFCDNPRDLRLFFTRLTAKQEKKGKCIAHFPFFNLEREKSLELSTYTLARYRSTN